MNLATLAHLLNVATLQYEEEHRQRPVIAVASIRGAIEPAAPIELLALNVTLGSPAEAFILFDPRLSAEDRASMTEAAHVHPTREIHAPPGRRQ